MKAIVFRYRFTFQNGAVKEYTLRLDPDTMTLTPPPRASWPEWTRLGQDQCPNCPLQEAQHPRCPPAASIVDLVDAFRDLRSHEAVHVLVETKERIYAKHTSLQTAVASLLGLHLATAGCPILDRLRPMADTHLPFMNGAEVTYRMLSMHLVTQFFRHKCGESADWDLSPLLALLEQVQIVNLAFSRRLNSIRMLDANVNALVILSALGDDARLTLEERDMDRLERLFHSVSAPIDPGA